MSRSEKNENVLVWVITLGSVIATSFFFTQAMDPFNLPKAVCVIAIAVACLLGYPVLILNFKRYKLMPILPFVLFIISVVASAVISTESKWLFLFGSFSRATGVLTYFAYVIIAATLILTVTSKSYLPVFLSLGLVAVVETIYGTLQFFNLDPVSWVNGYNRIIGTLGNPNFMSAVLGFTSVALFGVACAPIGNLKLRISSALIALMEIFLAVQSQSIQGPIIAGFGIAIVVGGLIFRTRGKGIIFYTYAGISTFALAIALAGVAKFGPLANYLYQYTLGVREQYWRAAFKMMASSPLTGIGSDSYGNHYRLVRDTQTFKVVGPQVFSNAAHSVPLQIGATFGVISLLLYLVIQLLTFIYAVKAIQSQSKNRYLLLALFASWIAFQAQSLISIDQVGIGIWGWLLSAVIIGFSVSAIQNQKDEKISTDVKNKKQLNVLKKSESRIGRVLILSLFGYVIGFAVYWKAAYLPDLLMRTAISTPYDKQNQSSILYRLKQLEIAFSQAPEEPTYKLILIQEMLNMPGTGKEVLAYSEKAARQFSYSWDAQNVAATVFESAGMFEKALAYRKSTIDLDPYNYQIWLTYASDLQSIGKITDAKFAYAKVAELGALSPEAETATASLKKLS